jgi:hypothetical protein
LEKNGQKRKREVADERRARAQKGVKWFWKMEEEEKMNLW